MRIHVTVKGHYEWAECPAGTKITKADVDALRVKQLSDGKWHMRVEIDRDTHTDIGVHESEICERLAALEKLGQQATRHDVVLEQVRAILPHHIARKHIVGFEVHDDLSPELFRAALVRAEVDPARHDELVDEYSAPCDFALLLSATFKPRARAAAETK